MYMLSKDKPFKTSFYNPYNTKKRTRTTPEQLEALETIFQCTSKPAMQVRKELSIKLDMPLRNIQVWFQNRRAKAKSTNCFPQETGTAECAVRNLKSLSGKAERSAQLTPLDPAALAPPTDLALPVWASQDQSQVYSPLDEYFNSIDFLNIPAQYPPTPQSMGFLYPHATFSYQDPFMPFYSAPCMSLYPQLE
ncbi:hypothetical protein DSO57_1020038 [Entomophthora muscae]|uniref:Uncharacterized protein n=1 Tax=Entomophthora muscae TaxID=34485 RepID=A0ACC2S5Y2_9FUNG|nr:hypothetical protein DSO57_1020038 [Entomophthora muscae]